MRVVRALINRIKNCNFIVIYLNHRPIIHARGSAEALRQQSSASKSPPPAVRRSSGQCKWMCKFSLQPSVCVCMCVFTGAKNIFTAGHNFCKSHTHTFTNQMIPFGCPRLVPHNTTNKLKLHTWHYWPCQCMCVCVNEPLFLWIILEKGARKRNLFKSILELLLPCHCYCCFCDICFWFLKFMRANCSSVLLLHEVTSKEAIVSVCGLKCCQKQCLQC